MIAEDQTQEGSRRRSCAEAVGRLGEKEKAADILVTLYLAQEDKTKDQARWIYDAPWKVTGV